MARYKKSRKGAGRQKLSARDKQLFKISKLWFAMGGAIESIAKAAAVSNFHRSKDLREKAEQKITRRRPPVKPNQISSRGTYVKSTVALPAPSPPRYYQKWSLNVVQMDKFDSEMKSVKNTYSGKTTNFKFEKYIVGTVRSGSDNSKPRVSGKTVPYYLETGVGSQQRYHRQVPAIPRDKKGIDKPGRWDGATWRDEYTNKPHKMRTPVFQQEIWWKALHRFGQAPDEPEIDGMNPTYDFAWKKVKVQQYGHRSWMQTSWETVLRHNRKYLAKAREAFPRFARKFIKVSKEGEFRV